MGPRTWNKNAPYCGVSFSFELNDLIQHAQFKVAFYWPRAPSSNKFFLTTYFRGIRYESSQVNSQFSGPVQKAILWAIICKSTIHLNSLRLSANHWFKFWKLSTRKRHRRILKTINSHWSNKTPFQIRFFPENFCFL